MTNPTTNREFVVIIENKPGTVAEVTNALGKANINIAGFLVNANGEFGTIRLVTNDANKTESWLKTSGHNFQAHEVLTVPISDKPGELGRITNTLAKSGVNINASYPTTTPNGVGVTIAVDNISNAKKILSG